MNQLYDCNNTSIVKTLLLQMPEVTFTQFRSELTRVLGTRQCSKSSMRVVLVSTMESDLGNDEALSKTKQKCQSKMSAQSSQIQDLCSKLDAALVENAQVQKLLNPSTLQTVVSSTLEVVWPGGVVSPMLADQVDLSWVNLRNRSCLWGRMVPQTQIRSVGIVKIPVTN